MGFADEAGHIMPLLRSFQAVTIPYQWPCPGEMGPGLRRGDEKTGPRSILAQPLRLNPSYRVYCTIMPVKT
jgi:hypothetical protein